MTHSVRSVTLDEFHQEMRSQGTASIEEVTFRCPRCGTLQSANDLIAAGAGENLEEVERYLAFSCVGRWTDEMGCDWTLGGLFQIHEYEVVTDDGARHPRFEPKAR